MAAPFEDDDELRCMVSGTASDALDLEMTCYRTNVLTWQVCLHTLRDPRMLPCLHTMCTECVDGLITVATATKEQEARATSTRRVPHIIATNYTAVFVWLFADTSVCATKPVQFSAPARTLTSAPVFRAWACYSSALETTAGSPAMVGFPAIDQPEPPAPMLTQVETPFCIRNMPTLRLVALYQRMSDVPSPL